MKNLMSAFAVAALLAVVASAPAGEGARNVSKKGLSAMGIPGLKVMSDAEGTRVRGTYASVSGVSGAYATTGFSSASAVTGYSASGRFFAAGSNSVAAGATIIIGGSTFSSAASAGGSSRAVGF